MLFLLASAAFAGDRAPAPEIRYEKVSEVDFKDEVDVKGELVKPRINPVFEAMRSSFNPLFPLRLSFDREILESAAEVR